MKARALAVVCALAAMGGIQWDADAAVTSMGGLAFHTSNEGIYRIHYIGSTPYNNSSLPLYMAAGLARVPGKGDVTVSMEGSIVVGTYTCTVYSAGYAARSFTIPSVSPGFYGTWAQAVTFTAAEAPSGARLSVSCTVPEDGALSGVTVTN